MKEKTEVNRASEAFVRVVKQAVFEKHLLEREEAKELKELYDRTKCATVAWDQFFSDLHKDWEDFGVVYVRLHRTQRGQLYLVSRVAPEDICSYYVKSDPYNGPTKYKVKVYAPSEWEDLVSAKDMICVKKVTVTPESKPEVKENPFYKV